MSGAPDDAEVQARLAAFLDGLQQLGWTDGRNVRIDTRWARDLGADHSAEELVALAPDIILASASANVAALQRTARRFLVKPELEQCEQGQQHDDDDHP